MTAVVARVFATVLAVAAAAAANDARARQSGDPAARESETSIHKTGIDPTNPQFSLNVDNEFVQILGVGLRHGTRVALFDCTEIAPVGEPNAKALNFGELPFAVRFAPARRVAEPTVFGVFPPNPWAGDSDDCTCDIRSGKCGVRYGRTRGKSTARGGGSTARSGEGFARAIGGVGEDRSST